MVYNVKQTDFSRFEIRFFSFLIFWNTFLKNHWTPGKFWHIKWCWNVTKSSTTSLCFYESDTFCRCCQVWRGSGYQIWKTTIWYAGGLRGCLNDISHARLIPVSGLLAPNDFQNQVVDQITINHQLSLSYDFTNRVTFIRVVSAWHSDLQHKHYETACKKGERQKTNDSSCLVINQTKELSCMWSRLGTAMPQISKHIIAAFSGVPTSTTCSSLSPLSDSVSSASMMVLARSVAKMSTSSGRTLGQIPNMREHKLKYVVSARNLIQSCSEQSKFDQKRSVRQLCRERLQRV